MLREKNNAKRIFSACAKGVMAENDFTVSRKKARKNVIKHHNVSEGEGRRKGEGRKRRRKKAKKATSGAGKRSGAISLSAGISILGGAGGIEMKTLARIICHALASPCAAGMLANLGGNVNNNRNAALLAHIAAHHQYARRKWRRS